MADATPVRVWLIGAGPGDPELLTLRAARLLATADIVIHDALVGTGVLELARPGAELIDVGKRPGFPVPQEHINELLVTFGRGSSNIVRLKGGDPFVFGRGGEEAQALLEAGVAFAIVPGVTSAVYGPMVAGVPVTHRGLAASFAVVTGHRRRGELDPDWASLAALALSGTTLVVMMGVSERGNIAEALHTAGLPLTTPVVVTVSAGMPSQRIVRGDLGSLADADIEAPSVIVIGAVAALDVRSPSEQIDT